MGKIIKFPVVVKPVVDAPPVKKVAPITVSRGKGFLAGVVKTLWVMTVLVWPILRWILALDVVFKLVAMLWAWNTPGSNAGWIFLFHFSVLFGFTYFVSVYKPKGY